MQEKQPRVAEVLKSVKKRTCHEFLENCGAIKEFRRNWVSYLKDNKIDLIIFPGFACPAIKHGYAGNLFSAVAYSGLFNLLDVPTGCMPITLTRKDEEKYESKHNDDITKDLQLNM